MRIVLLIAAAFPILVFPSILDVDLNIDYLNTRLEGVPVELTTYGIFVKGEIPLVDWFDVDLKFDLGLTRVGYSVSLGKLDAGFTYHVPPILGYHGLSLGLGYRYVPWLENSPYLSLEYQPIGLNVGWKLNDTFWMKLKNMFGTGIWMSYDTSNDLGIGFSGRFWIFNVDVGIEKSLERLGDFSASFHARFGVSIPSKANLRLKVDKIAVKPGEPVKVSVEKISGLVPSGKVAVVFRSVTGKERILGFLGASGRFEKDLKVDESGTFTLKPTTGGIELETTDVRVRVKRFDLPKLKVDGGVLDGNVIYVLEGSKLRVSSEGNLYEYKDGSFKEIIESVDEGSAGLVLEKGGVSEAHRIVWVKRPVLIEKKSIEAGCKLSFDVGGPGLIAKLNILESLGGNVKKVYNLKTVSNYSGDAVFIIPPLLNSKASLTLETPSGFPLEKAKWDGTLECEPKRVEEDGGKIRALVGGLQKGIDYVFEVKPDSVSCEGEVVSKLSEVMLCRIEDLSVEIEGSSYKVRSIMEVGDRLYVIPKVEYRRMKIEDDKIGVLGSVGKGIVYYSEILRGERDLPLGAVIDEFDIPTFTFEHDPSNVKLRLDFKNIDEVVVDGVSFGSEDTIDLSPGLHTLEIYSEDFEGKTAVFIDSDKCSVFSGKLKADLRDGECIVKGGF